MGREKGGGGKGGQKLRSYASKSKGKKEKGKSYITYYDIILSARRGKRGKKKTHRWGERRGEREKLAWVTTQLVRQPKGKGRNKMYFP